MEAILNADFDIDNPSKTERGDYYAKITRFLSGGCEVVMKCVRPMAHAKYAEQWEQGFPVSMLPKKEKSASEIEVERAQNHRRAVRKAKQTTRFLCQQMKADRLLTLTYRENVEDREQVRKQFKEFVRYVHKGWKGQPGMPNWRYVAVLERQERGAYHVHCAVQGWNPVKFLRMCWYKALGAAGDATKENAPGQIDLSPPRNHSGASRKKEWAVDRLAFYIVKYMQKTFDETSTEKNRYWRSKDIVKPEQYMHWLVATNLTAALNELYRHMDFAEGFQLKKHWLSNDDMVYWCAGVGG